MVKLTEACFVKNQVLEWCYSQSGLILIRNKRTSQVYALKDSYILLWVLLKKDVSFRELKKKSGFESVRLENMLVDLLKKKLIRKIHSQSV